MKTLRVRLDGPWSPARREPWALLVRGDVVRADVGTSAEWPEHDRLELVIGAAHVRIVAVQLPPLPRARVAAAARFEVEDQIAGGESNAHVAVSAQRADGTVLAILCPRDVLASVCSGDRALDKLECVVVEPELLSENGAWWWCAGDDPADAFVRLPDGSAFAVSAVDGAHGLPAELRVALAQQRSAGASDIVVAWPAHADDLARWEHESGVHFVPGAPFDWRRAPLPVTATDLRQAEFAPRQERETRDVRAWRVLRPAAVLLACALVLHVLATLGEWVSLRIASWRADNAWQTLAVAADLPRDARSSVEALRGALAQKHRSLLHAQRRFARDDALPLLARATPALPEAAGPAVKRAVYQSQHWTLEIEGVAPDLAATLESRLRAAGLETLGVPAQNGLRVRFGMP